MGMKADLTAEQARAMFDYSPETGLLIWRVRADRPDWWNGRHAGKPAGYRLRDGHLQVDVRGGRGARKARPYLVHRLVWLWVYGTWPRGLLDHRDGDPSNNRIANLREVTPSQNTMNSRPRKNKKSAVGVTGVRWNERRKKWHAYIGVDGKLIDLYWGDSYDAAVSARREAEPLYFGEFAYAA